jgi:hypothetical protein
MAGNEPQTISDLNEKLDGVVEVLVLVFAAIFEKLPAARKPALEALDAYVEEDRSGAGKAAALILHELLEA